MSLQKLKRALGDVQSQQEETIDAVEQQVARTANYDVDGFSTGTGELSATLSIGGTTTIKGKLSVAASVIMGNALDIGGKLTVSKNAIIISSLSIAQTATIVQSLSVGGTTGLNTISAGNINVSSKISVGGDVNINGNLSIIGNTTYTSIESETVSVKDNMIRLNANIASSQGYTPSVDIGFFGQTTINTNVNKYVGVAWDNSANAIVAFHTGSIPLTEIESPSYLDFRAKSNILTGELSVSGNSTFGEVSMTRLSIANPTTFGSSISVGGQTTIGEGIYVVATMSVANADTLKSDVSIGKNITISAPPNLFQIVDNNFSKSLDIKLDAKPACQSLYNNLFRNIRQKQRKKILS